MQQRVAGWIGVQSIIQLELTRVCLRKIVDTIDSAATLGPAMHAIRGLSEVAGIWPIQYEADHGAAIWTSVVLIDLQLSE
jgi:hypothetical protein